jgi:hypothetical protein
VTDNCNSTNDPQRTVYQIRTEGHLDPQWTDWFDGMAVTKEEDGTMLLTGQVCDQAALYSLIKKVRDLGMTLLSVNRLKPDQLDATSRPIRQTNKDISELYEKEKK